ncbi:hypothetical protein CAI21_12185, partial [Alkalilimnicola ehrlichii]
NRHRLVDLIRRLSSYLEVRVMGNEYREFNESFFVADRLAYLHRPTGDRFDGRVCFHDPLAARRLLGLFDEMWEYGTHDPNFRRLHL